MKNQFLWIEKHAKTLEKIKEILSSPLALYDMM